MRVTPSLRSPKPAPTPSFWIWFRAPGARLREKLGVEEVTIAEASAVRAELPSSPEGSRLYSNGLAKLRRYDAQAARDLLAKAANADPGSALIHSALAEAWIALGYDEKAKEEAKSALDLSAGLSRERRLFIEGGYWETTKDWDKAIDTYSSRSGARTRR